MKNTNHTDMSGDQSMTTNGTTTNTSPSGPVNPNGPYRPPYRPPFRPPLFNTYRVRSLNFEASKSSRTRPARRPEKQEPSCTWLNQSSRTRLIPRYFSWSLERESEPGVAGAGLCGPSSYLIANYRVKSAYPRKWCKYISRENKGGILRKSKGRVFLLSF